jgi:hypothetical protein
MTKEALKQALEALESDYTFEWPAMHRPERAEKKRFEAITAIKQALAQPAQERNFCARCGKRTADLTVIHTCTPPQEKT